MSVDSKIEGAIEGAPDNGYHRDILRFRPWGRQASHDTKPVRDYDIIEWGTYMYRSIGGAASSQ